MKRPNRLAIILFLAGLAFVGSEGTVAKDVGNNWPGVIATIAKDGEISRLSPEKECASNLDAESLAGETINGKRVICTPR